MKPAEEQKAKVTFGLITLSSRDLVHRELDGRTNPKSVHLFTEGGNKVKILPQLLIYTNKTYGEV